MNKKEFLDRLDVLLHCLPADKRAESKAFYAEAIDDRMEDGASEEDAVAALGSPGEVAEAILDELPAVPRAVAKTRRKSRALMWALIILGSPLWAALLLAFAATALGVYVAIWALAASLWIVAAAFACGLPLCIVTVYWGIMAGNIPYAIVQAGAGLVCASLGLATAVGAFAASRQLVRLSRAWASKALSPFVGRGKRAQDAAQPAA